MLSHYLTLIVILMPMTLTATIQKVPICHNGETIWVAGSTLKARIKAGDLVGKCPPGSTKMDPITNSNTSFIPKMAVILTIAPVVGNVVVEQSSIPTISQPTAAPLASSNATGSVPITANQTSKPSPVIINNTTSATLGSTSAPDNASNALNQTSKPSPVIINNGSASQGSKSNASEATLAPSTVPIKVPVIVNEISSNSVPTNSNKTESPILNNDANNMSGSVSTASVAAGNRSSNGDHSNSNSTGTPKPSTTLPLLNSSTSSSTASAIPVINSASVPSIFSFTDVPSKNLNSTSPFKGIHDVHGWKSDPSNVEVPVAMQTTAPTNAVSTNKVLIHLQWNTPLPIFLRAKHIIYVLAPKSVVQSSSQSSIFIN